MPPLRWPRLAAAVLLVIPIAVHAQKLTLAQAIEQARSKYPAVRISEEQVQSAAAAIQLARTAYLPRADFLGQVNRATRNNIFGLVLPQPLPVIPTISGPVLNTNNLTNVWGSAVGFLVSWEPFDFGRRRADIDVAESGKRHAEASVARTRFEVETLAADAFLTILAADQAVLAAKAAVERARVLNDLTGAVVKADLRPGADASRARAELAAAGTQLIQAQQAANIARASLAQLINMDALAIAPEPGGFLALPEFAKLEPIPSLSENPAAKEQSAAIDEAKARQLALDRSYYPRFSLQGSSYARGSGANTDGTTGGVLSGFGPNIQNWAFGMTVWFPAFDLPSIRARKEIELHHERGEEARYEKLMADLRGQFDKARVTLEGARRIAENTPIELEAARDTERQATARYKAGLGTLVEVAEAERLLTQSEIDDSLARLSVWRALLGLAAAEGDLAVFLDKVK